MDLPTLLAKLRPILGDDQVSRYAEAIQLSDPKTAKVLEVSLRRQLAEATGDLFGDQTILLPPIPQELAAGPFELGTVRYGQQRLHAVGLRPEELLQHTMIFGRSGAGKTNASFLLLTQLVKHQVPFLIFDWKRNYRDLLRVPGFEKLVIYTVGRDDAPFFFNPLIPPPGVEPQEWLKKLNKLISHVFYGGHGVDFILQEIVNQCYEHAGVYQGSGRWPTFRDVFEQLRQRRAQGREAEWMRSVMRALAELCFGAIDRVLNSGVQSSLQSLLTQQAVLELDGLNTDEKNLLIEALLLWIHHYRLREPGREQLRHVLLIEEAHHILKGDSTGEETIVETVVREVRETGVAILALDQRPASFSKAALENSFTTICFNLKEKSDIATSAKSMLLDPEQTRWLGELPVGTAIVKLQGRWPKPFLVQFPHFKIEKGVVTDAEVHARLVQSLDVVTAAKMMKDGVDALVREFEQTFPELYAAPREGAAAEPGSKPATVSDRERALLDDILSHPASTTTERYARLDLHPQTGTRILNRLRAAGLIDSSPVRMGATRIVLLELTAAGRQALGVAETATQRYGGPEHRFWVERIFAQLQDAGVNVQKEAPIGEGKTVDLLVTKDGKRIAVEVETGKSDWKGNVRKCFDAGIDRVIVAATTPAVLRSVRKNLKRTAHVHPCLANDTSDALINLSGQDE